MSVRLSCRATNRRAVAVAFAVTAAVALGACPDGDGPDAPDADTADSHNADTADAAPEATPYVPPTAWGPEVSVLAFASSTEVAGDLATGTLLDGLWGAPDCYNAAVAMASYGGKARVYALDESQATPSTMIINLGPAPGVDLNLIAYHIPATAFDVPPQVPSLVNCRSSATQGPGGLESVELNAVGQQPYHVVIVVTGPPGTTSGSYSLTIQKVQK